MESLAKNPPIMELDFDTVYDRIINLIPKTEGKPDRNSVKSHLNNLQTILKEKEEIYKSNRMERRKSVCFGSIIFVLSEMGENEWIIC